MKMFRIATANEVAAHEKVEALLTTDELFEKALELVSDRLFNYDTSLTKLYYNRVYRFAKSLGVTVWEMDTWYFVEEE